MTEPTPEERLRALEVKLAAVVQTLQAFLAGELLEEVGDEDAGPRTGRLVFLVGELDKVKALPPKLPKAPVLPPQTSRRKRNA